MQVEKLRKEVKELNTQLSDSRRIILREEKRIKELEREKKYLIKQLSEE
jgi:hypothetical protein